MDPQALRAFPFLAGFTDDEVAALVEGGELWHLAPGTVLFHEGDPAETLYFLVEGELDTTILDQSGAGVPVSVVSPGEVVGWSAVIEPYVYTSTVRAVTASRIAVFGRPVLARALFHPHLAALLMQRIAEVVAHRLRDTQGRLAGFLPR